MVAGKEYPKELMWENIAPRLARLYDNAKLTNCSIDWMYKRFIELGADPKFGGNKSTGHGVQDLYASLTDENKVAFLKLVKTAEKELK